MSARALTQQESASAREKLVVALDFATIQEAEALVSALGDSVSFYKIGLELAYGGGLPFAQDLIKTGKQILLDLKLHDIPATVGRACAQVARLGVPFLTIHAYPRTMKAAKSAAAGSSLRLLGVTALTSYADCDLADAGYAYGVRDLVARARRRWNKTGRRGGRRPEKNHDTDRRHCRKGGLSRRRPAGDAGEKSARCGGCDLR
jgi:orotidine-5'-phosphate decarboxylase